VKSKHRHLFRFLIGSEIETWTDSILAIAINANLESWVAYRPPGGLRTALILITKVKLDETVCSKAIHPPAGVHV